MDYIHKIYYKNKEIHNETYNKRINFESTFKTGIKIQAKKSVMDLYYIPNIKTDNKIEKIRINDNKLKDLEAQLPSIIGESLLIEAISSELQSSNELEGVESNKEDIVYSTRKILSKKDDRSERFSSTINSYILLIDNKLNFPKDSYEVRKIYDKITDGEISNDDLPDGKIFRKNDVHINKMGTVSGQTIHKGMVGEDNIIKSIDQLLDFINNSKIPLLIKVAIGHYYIEYIHPFYDGNGRLGRFISSIYLESSYSYLTALSLSRGSYLQKANYYKAFDVTNSEKNKGELNFFIDVFLDLLIKGQEEMIENLIDKNEKFDELINSIENDINLSEEIDKTTLIGFLPNALLLFNMPISRDEIIDSMSLERYPVTQIKFSLNRLVKLGYLKTTKKRPIYYVINDKFILDGELK